MVQFQNRGDNKFDL